MCGDDSCGNAVNGLAPSKAAVVRSYPQKCLSVSALRVVVLASEPASLVHSGWGAVSAASHHRGED